MLAVGKSCTGCGSCAAVCQYHCIDMKNDKEGFLYPVIENNHCVSCGLCEQSCPVLTNRTTIQNPMTVSLAVQNKNDEVRKGSSSGGAFYALAISTLEQGGVVCAARYTSSYEVVHGIAKNKKELMSFCGAKYAQSTVWHCFTEIKKILQQGRRVLFVGTPCQVAGLQSFLKHPFDNLILVDLICHGVPSPLVWEKYMEERKNLDADGAEIASINLRDKSTGWSNYNYSVRFDYKNGRTHSTHQKQDNFMQGFVSNLYLRPSCSQCMFKGIERVSDITLGDYWGVWIQHPKFDDNAGTSLVILHSDKGKEMWASIQKEFRVLPISNEDATQYNPSALKSSYAAEQRELFFEGFYQGKTVSDLVQLCLSNQSGERLAIIKKILRIVRYRG